MAKALASVGALMAALDYAVPKGTILLSMSCPMSARPSQGIPDLLAPVTSDLLLVHSEIRFVGSDGAAAAKHDSRHPPDFGVAGDVK